MLLYKVSEIKQKNLSLVILLLFSDGLLISVSINIFLALFQKDNYFLGRKQLDERKWQFFGLYTELFTSKKQFNFLNTSNVYGLESRYTAVFWGRGEGEDGERGGEFVKLADYFMADLPARKKK